MFTRTLSASEEKDIFTAISLLQAGELVAVPTETVYGLAADAKNLTAVNKIFIAKNRPQNHPLIVHISSPDCLSEWARNIPTAAHKLAEAFWPGPLTILLKKHPQVNSIVTGGLETIALRIPKNQVLLRIIETLKTGLAAPSANLHKKISPTRADHVISSLGGRISAVLDAGPCSVGLESTILDLTQVTPKILRPGPITREMLENILLTNIEMPFQHNTNIPGNMKTHYKPQAETLLMSIEEISELLCNQKYTDQHFAVMHYSKLKDIKQKTKTIKMSPHKELYARDLYHTLHELDATRPLKILVETPPNNQAWADIWDRLSKACAKQI